MNTERALTNDPGKAFQRICRFCAYQERSLFETRKKLQEWKVSKENIAELLRRLQVEDYLDDNRFARSFARGKFQRNKWGKVRIRLELKARQIPENLISAALSEIDDQSYYRTIRVLVMKKKQAMRDSKPLNPREQIIRYLIGKGFETDVVLQVMSELEHLFD